MLGARVALAGALPFLFATFAEAAEPSPADVATARRLFQEATTLEGHGAWRDAGAKLDAALAIKETPGLHFHRAHCAEQLGELLLAARHYGRAEELIRAGAAAPDVEELLGAARARVLARVSRLAVTLPSDAPGATLEVDGTLLPDPFREPVLLNPGRHRIVARAPGRRDFEMEITLVAGQTQSLEVSLAPQPGRNSPAKKPAAESQSETGKPGFGTREIVLIAEGTVTVAGLAAGIGYSLAAASASDRVTSAQLAVDEAAENGSSSCRSSDAPPACVDLQMAIDDHERATRFATIGFVTAGAGAAATLLTWAFWPATGTATTASVAHTRGGATLVVRGRF
ncbi:MAG TPA: hypothetical protein VFZ53_09560 [Polyangiaceae bacterium]